jgi:hypothetical protein
MDSRSWSEEPAAPHDWAYHLFPLEAEGWEILSLDYVAEEGLRRVLYSLQTGDRTALGSTLHWAHLFRAQQAQDGAWPAVVNARTGEARGPERTRRPADFLAQLGHALCSSEFDAAVALARQYPYEGGNL